MYVFPGKKQFLWRFIVFPRELPQNWQKMQKNDKQMTTRNPTWQKNDKPQWQKNDKKWENNYIYILMTHSLWL